MSEFKQDFETAIEIYGLKKVLAEILKIAKIVGECSPTLRKGLLSRS